MKIFTYQSRTSEEELGQRRNIGEALQRGVHVARIAQVGKADKTTDMSTFSMIMSTLILLI